MTTPRFRLHLQCTTCHLDMVRTATGPELGAVEAPLTQARDEHNCATTAKRCTGTAVLTVGRTP